MLREFTFVILQSIGWQVSGKRIACRKRHFQRLIQHFLEAILGIHVDLLKVTGG
jgi:hypothetical protein